MHLKYPPCQEASDMSAMQHVYSQRVCSHRVCAECARKVSRQVIELRFPCKTSISYQSLPPTIRPKPLSCSHDKGGDTSLAVLSIPISILVAVAVAWSRTHAVTMTHCQVSHLGMIPSSGVLTCVAMSAVLHQGAQGTGRENSVRSNGPNSPLHRRVG